MFVGDAVSGDDSDITSDIVAGDSPYYWANLSYEATFA